MKTPPIQSTATLKQCRIEYLIDIADFSSKAIRNEQKNRGAQSQKDFDQPHAAPFEDVALTKYKAVGPNSLEIAWRFLAKNR